MSNTLAWGSAAALVLAAEGGDFPQTVIEWVSLLIALLMAYLSWRKQRGA